MSNFPGFHNCNVRQFRTFSLLCSLIRSSFLSLWSFWKYPFSLHPILIIELASVKVARLQCSGSVKTKIATYTNLKKLIQFWKIKDKLYFSKSVPICSFNLLNICYNFAKIIRIAATLPPQNPMPEPAPFHRLRLKRPAPQQCSLANAKRPI